MPCSPPAGLPMLGCCGSNIIDKDWTVWVGAHWDVTHVRNLGFVIGFANSIDPTTWPGGYATWLESRGTWKASATDEFAVPGFGYNGGFNDSGFSGTIVSNMGGLTGDQAWSAAVQYDIASAPACLWTRIWFFGPVSMPSCERIAVPGRYRVLAFDAGGDPVHGFNLGISTVARSRELPGAAPGCCNPAP